jgi:hypothetical protein
MLDGQRYTFTERTDFQPRCKVMQTQLQEQLSLSDTEIILAHLPERIRTALIARAAEIEYPFA